MSSSSAAPSAPVSASHWGLDSDLHNYSALRHKNFYIGMLLIPTACLKVDHTFQRPIDHEHAEDIKPMYSNDMDTRNEDPLECIVHSSDEEKFKQWLDNQDSSLLAQTQPEHMLVLNLSDTLFPIVKGQHCYEAYCQVMKEDKLPKDAPHPGHLAVKLYYSGV